MKDLRLSNENLIKYVCRHSLLGKYTSETKTSRGCKDRCGNNFDCQNCVYPATPEEQTETTSNHAATQEALGMCIRRTAKQIGSLENQGASVTLEMILTYAYIAKVPLHELIQLQEGYSFDENGIIRRDGDPEYIPYKEPDEQK